MAKAPKHQADSYLVVKHKGMRFAFALNEIQEVGQTQGLTPENSPPHRIDLFSPWQQSHKEENQSPFFLIMQHNNEKIAVAVDEVLGIEALHDHKRYQIPKYIFPEHRTHLEQVFSDGDTVTFLLKKDFFAPRSTEMKAISRES